MNRISARWRITMGLVGILVSVLMLAVALGLMPDRREAVLEGRARVCETLAVGTSILATRGDVSGLQTALQGVAARNHEIISAAVRREDGKFVAVVGEHEKAWKQIGQKSNADSNVYVPIWSGDKKWGTVEVQFRPLSGGGLLGLLFRPAVALVLFISSVCFLAYLGYLRKVLQHLDPSKAVPGRVRSALDTLAEGLLVMDHKERIVLANQAFATIAGRSHDSLLGTRASKLAWVEETESPKPWTIAIEKGIEQRNCTLQMRDADGKTRSFVVNCAPVLGQGGKHHGVLTSFEDVTQLESQKLELSKSKLAADAANQAKSEFLARMSHEIRTPMNAILGFADVLRRGFEQSEAERQEYLETIHASGQHLLDLINDILDLSKIESGRMQLELASCSPHQIISEVLAVLRVKAEQKNIKLDYKWDGPLPETIVTDPTRVRQVLTNIISNAIKFTDQGSVTVVARLQPQEDNARLAIDVIDTGIGIQAESLQNLFKPFVQADTSITRRFGGTGLGLSISRQLAEALGGGIKIESEYGAGSKFTMTVNVGPLEGVRFLDKQPAAFEHARSKSAQSVHLPALRVLSVEDGESNQKLISLVLRRSGVAIVDQAFNGKVGVEMALREKYDVILMDMQMPVMDGYTAAGELRKQGLATPIIALTAHAMKGEEEKCLSAGCTGYLPKPIEVDALLRKVADAVGHVTSPETSAPLREVAYTGPKIKSRLPSDDADFREVIVEFVDRLHEQLSEMQSAWESRELSRIASLAHWLKGSGGSAGFDAFTTPARQLEKFAKENRLEDIEQTIVELNRLAASIELPTEPATPVQQNANA